MNIALGTDHRGFAYKENLKKMRQCGGVPLVWHDFGAFNEERSDYPLFAQAVCHALQKGVAQRGILLCGTGVGMAIAANRFKNIYAALAWNEEIARLSAHDDNANVLVIPADYVSEAMVHAMVLAWLTTPFKEGRYAQRIALIDACDTE